MDLTNITPLSHEEYMAFLRTPRHPVVEVEQIIKRLDEIDACCIAMFGHADVDDSETRNIRDLAAIARIRADKLMAEAERAVNARYGIAA